MFYDDGLCFECQRCLYCCSQEPGYVFLSEKDIENGSQVLGLSKEEFIAIYCRYVDFGNYSMVSLKEKDNYDCIFLTKNGCSIYEGRPSQCRTYPFWESIVESRVNWESEGKSCPGIGKGRKISRKEIEKELEKGRTNVPYMVFGKRRKK